MNASLCSTHEKVTSYNKEYCTLCSLLCRTTTALSTFPTNLTTQAALHATAALTCYSCTAIQPHQAFHLQQPTIHPPPCPPRPALIAARGTQLLWCPGHTACTPIPHTPIPHKPPMPPCTILPPDLYLSGHLSGLYLHLSGLYLHLS
jgi:hypothetical protein